MSVNNYLENLLSVIKSHSQKSNGSPKEDSNVPEVHKETALNEKAESLSTLSPAKEIEISASEQISSNDSSRRVELSALELFRETIRIEKNADSPMELKTNDSPIPGNSGENPIPIENGHITSDYHLELSNASERTEKVAEKPK